MDNTRIQTTDIIPTEADRLDDLKPDPGVPDGTVVTDPSGQENTIVYDYDENNEVIGWHKEVVA